MPLTCNIDAKGKVARLIWGLLILVIAALLALLWAWPTGGWGRWLITLAMAAMGAFSLFEARAGWCAVRAMGIRTKF